MVGEDLPITIPSEIFSSGRFCFFGVSESQRSLLDEIKVTYYFPKGHIQKGWFENGDFIPCKTEYFQQKYPEPLKPQQKVAVS